MIDNKVDVRLVSDRLGSLYSEMIFVHGYVHCDPHPGNILVRKTRNDTQLVLLDHGLYVTLTDQLRHRYSMLWLSVLNRDLEGMKRWATELGVGHMYGLLACVITAKPWSAVLKGITNKRNQSDHKAEQDELRRHVGQYFPQITELLSKVPRELLLIFKTNDLIRGIETSLGTRGQRRSLITMSECCVRTVYAERYRKSSIFSLLFLLMAEYWTLVKLRMFKNFLYICSLVWGQDYY